jgi:hypothetical protein
VGIYVGGAGRVGRVSAEGNVAQGADYGVVICGQGGVSDVQARRNIHDPEGNLTPEQIDKLLKRQNEDNRK